MSKNQTQSGFSYEVGDRVRIWTIFKQPVGSIQKITEEGSLKKYEVYYVYHDGRYFTDVFDFVDLTLVDRLYNWDRCTCGSNSEKHSDYCYKKTKLRG
jgi:hypothetical protein